MVNCTPDLHRWLYYWLFWLALLVAGENNNDTAEN
jgi:hypothetical protein